MALSMHAAMAATAAVATPRCSSRSVAPSLAVRSSPLRRSEFVPKLAAAASSPAVRPRMVRENGLGVRCNYLGKPGGLQATPAGAGPGLGSLLVAIAIPVVGGAIASFVSGPNSAWYKKLKKPDWEPNTQAFGLVWTVLYALMGYASWLVWREGGFDVQGSRLKVYALQLFLNLLWPVITFGWKNLSLSLIEIVALLIASIYNYQAFAEVSSLAGQLMAPLVAWVVFATALNYNLWRNNRGPPESPAGTDMGTV